MITWMQKHNKFLIWTIWIATISFIGTGAVVGISGGSVKAGTIAKVGDVEIKQSKLNMVYSSIYNQYNQMLQGKLDKKRAQEMGLVKQAFSRVETQAKIINLAQELGIVVSDEEVAQKLYKIKGFQEDGAFSRDIYNEYLKGQRLKTTVFENTLRDELMVQKTLDLFDVETLSLEKEAVGAAMSISDKIAYQVLTTADLNMTTKTSDVKAFWEMQKESYMTKKIYTLSIVWTEMQDNNLSDEELKNFYEQNSFKYSDAKGKQLTFTEAKSMVEHDLKLKKTKKVAQKAYVAFKKGKKSSDETITLPLGDLKLTPKIWNVVNEKSVGDIIKPKIVVDSYATIKIDSIVEPRVKSFEEAKDAVTYVYKKQAEKQALMDLAEARVKDFDMNGSIVSDFIKIEQNVNLEALNKQESIQFVKKLFTSSKEKGMISVLDKVIVYNIMEQKFESLDENKTDTVDRATKQMKDNILQVNLIKILDEKYSTEVYTQGLTN